MAKEKMGQDDREETKDNQQSIVIKEFSELTDQEFATFVQEVYENAKEDGVIDEEIKNSYERLRQQWIEEGIITEAENKECTKEKTGKDDLQNQRDYRIAEAKKRMRGLYEDDFSVEQIKTARDMLCEPNDSSLLSDADRELFRYLYDQWIAEKEEVQTTDELSEKQWVALAISMHQQSKEMGIIDEETELEFQRELNEWIKQGLVDES